MTTPVTVHLLDEGAALCAFGFPDVPGRWPEDHRWILRGDDLRRISSLTWDDEHRPIRICQACLEADRNPKTPHRHAAWRLRLLLAAEERAANEILRQVAEGRALCDEMEAAIALPLEQYVARAAALFRRRRA